MDVENDSAVWQAHQTQAKNYAKFYPKWKRNNFESEKQGREVGELKDYVMIICPGQPKSEVHQEVKAEHQAEYPAEWAAYKAGKEQRINGTPIELLPGLETSRADSMKALYVHTIEQLAEASEPALRAIGMGALELQQRAKAFMQKNSTEAVQLREQLAAKDEQIADLQTGLQQLKEQLQELTAQLLTKKKPGRPRKVETA